MTRHLPLSSAFLLLGLIVLCAGCGNGSTAPTTSQAQTPQQAGEQAKAQAEAQGEAAAKAAAAQRQAAGVH